MWLSHFLLALCATCCFAQSQSGSVSYTHHSEYRDSKAVLAASISGPCLTENCDGYKPSEATDEAYPNQENGVTVENPAKNGYKPQNPDPDHPIYDKSIHVEFCTFIQKAVKKLELMHPETANVTTVVLKDLATYILSISVSNGEDCDPAMHVLDLIIMAAQKLRLDYIKFTENYCTYTEIPDTDKSSQTPVYSSTEYRTDAPRASTEVTGIPEITTSKYPHPGGTDSTKNKTMKPTDAPCTDKSTAGYKPTDKPCTDKPSGEHKEPEDIIAEDEYYPYPPFIGSVRGMPGEHYPNYKEIPMTSFSCADKKYIPGFYADLETGCQVFHVCYEHRRESFLCPLGTIFNQPILACDYWYSSNCSLAPIYYEVNAKTKEVMKPDKIDLAVDELMSSIVGKQKVPGETSDSKKFSDHVLDDIAKFLPVKAQVTVLSDTHSVDETKIVLAKKPERDVEGDASDIFDNILTTATRVVSKTRDSIASIPKPSEAEVEIKKPLPIKPASIKSVAAPILKMKKVPAVKVKMAKAAVPIVAKVAAAKAVVPLVVKAKLAETVPVAKVVATKAAVSVAAKAKLAAKVPIVAKAKLAAASVPIAAKLAAKSVVVPSKVLTAKAAVPILAKGKVAAALPIAKTVAMKASVPVVAKTKFVAAAVPKVAVKASVPVLKTKILAASLPFAKSAALKKSALPVAKAKIVVPALKAKVVKTATAPMVKGKILAIPLAKSKLLSPVAKTKLAKAAVISPLTKKALALGYMKLLKAKKLALMG